MTKPVITRLVRAVALVLAVVLGPQGPAHAADPDDEFDLPAGEGCVFALTIEIRGGNQVYKEFTDKNDNLVRTLSAGKGSELTFINQDTSATLTIKTGGSVTQVTLNPEGSKTYVTTGHNVLTLFPSDVPAGPSTTLYLGRVVFVVGADGVFTLQRTSGNSTDICAALS